MFVLSESSNTCVDPLDIVVNRILTRPGSLCCQILCSVEKHGWRWRESTCALELANFGLSVVVLHCTRVSARRLANHDIAKPDHPVISLHRHAASDANQHTEPEVRERHPHLGDDCSRGAIAWLMQSRNDDVMAS